MAADARVRSLRVLVDSNIVLDALLQREPWYTAARPFWHARDEGQILAHLPASAVTDIFYIGRRHAGLTLARQAVERCVREFALLSVDRAVLEAALALAGPDIEDNVQIVCAHRAGLDLNCHARPVRISSCAAAGGRASGGHSVPQRMTVARAPAKEAVAT